jgi:hypothetical protein
MAIIYPLRVEEIKYLQRTLGVTVDGLVGPNMLTAIRSVTGTRRDEIGTLVDYAQRVINKSNTGAPIKVDGVFGPITEYRMGKLVKPVFAPIPKKGLFGTDLVLPERSAFNATLPADNTRELKAYYGEPGEHLVRMKFPYPMFYGDQLVKTTLVHPKAKEAFENLFVGVAKAYSQADIIDLELNAYSGCFNNRAVRGGSRLSTHAFAIAMDLCAAKNRLRTPLKYALFGQTKYQGYWDAVYAAGFTSLGLEFDRDVMHISLTR